MPRHVILKLTVELAVETAENTDADLINFCFNEGTHCADNFLDNLNELRDRLEEKGQCLCSFIKSKYQREATEQDLDKFQLT